MVCCFFSVHGDEETQMCARSSVFNEKARMKMKMKEKQHQIERHLTHVMRFRKRKRQIWLRRGEKALEKANRIESS